MFLKDLIRQRTTVAFRLTLWYASIFTVSLVLIFSIFYLMTLKGLHRRRDEDLHSNYKEFSALLASQGDEALRADMLREAASQGADQCFIRLLDFQGRVVASSDMASWQGIEKLLPPLKHGQSGKPHLKTVDVARHRHQARVLQAVIGRDRVLQIGQLLDDDERLLADFKEVFGSTILLAMALAAVAGWFMARHAIAGVDAVTCTALEIANGSFERRVPRSGRGDEIDRMAATFNLMLERIQSLVGGMKEITDNIAHDLRSPLTRIRGAAEMALTGGAALPEYEAVTASTVEECDRLLGLINTMLEISAAEAGMAHLHLSCFDLAAMVRDACELFQPVAEDKGILFSCEAAAPAPVEGDLQRLQRALANLLDNAIKYTPPGGTVRVSMHADPANLRIIVDDSGIGISERDLPHIFDRFYRGDQSRSQSGNGLGLCLAQTIARAHQGIITVESQPGRHSTFVMSIPRVAL